MGKAKVVLDTNVLVSALGWEGSPKDAFLCVIEGKAGLFISRAQLKELSEVLSYPKLGFKREQAERFIALILELAVVVKPKGKINAVGNDPDDNRILEAAVEGNVDYVVTGDSDLLDLKVFNGIKIVTPKEFLQKITK